MLQPYFTVYAIATRGPAEAGGSGVMRDAEDVATAVQEIGGPVLVFGHSYGGICSLEAALLTGGIRKLVLYEAGVPAGVSLFPADVLDRVQALIDAGESEAALAMLYLEVFGVPDHELDAYRQLPAWRARSQLTSRIVREMHAYRDYSFKAERFSGLQVPTMLLLDDESPPWVRQGIRLIHDTLPNSRLVSLPAGYGLTADRGPAPLVATMVRFLLTK
jgi:pimeloyl-ACP methyl ester carboxylesterase